MYRFTITSQYLGSNSMHLHLRFVCSQAINVEPEPPNGSNTSSPGLDEFLTPYAHNAIGFIVGCSPFLNGLLKRHIESHSIPLLTSIS